MFNIVFSDQVFIFFPPKWKMINSLTALEETHLTKKYISHYSLSNNLYQSALAILVYCNTLNKDFELKNEKFQSL